MNALQISAKLKSTTDATKSARCIPKQQMHKFRTACSASVSNAADFILCQSLMKVKGAAEDDWQDTIGDGGRHNLTQLWLLPLLLKLA
jgi:hypothetical protein